MRIESLTFLRFVAALIVVIFHYGQKATGWSGFLVAGPQMVTFFFVLSGFVMAIAYGNKPGVRFLPYLWARIARIVPIHWVALGIVVALQVVREVWFGLDALNLFLNITLLQTWLLELNPLNYPSWSLSVELFFYVTFPWMLPLCKKLMRWPGAFLSTVFGVWFVVQFGFSNWLMANDGAAVKSFIDYSPLSHLPSFVIGLVGGLHFKERNWYRSSGLLSLVGTVVAGVLIVLVLNHAQAIETALGRPLADRSSLYAPLFLVLILSLASSRWAWSELLAWKPLVLLGDASYSFYILQLPIFQLYVLYLRPNADMGTLDGFLVYLAVLLVVSLVTYRWIEKPINSYLRSKKPFFILRG